MQQLQRCKVEADTDSDLEPEANVQLYYHCVKLLCDKHVKLCTFRQAFVIFHLFFILGEYLIPMRANSRMEYFNILLAK